MHPEPVAAALSDVAADDAIFTADTGMCNVWSSRYIRPTQGSALDRLIHAWLHGKRTPSVYWRPTSPIPEDRLSQWRETAALPCSWASMLTVTQYNLPIKIVVFNNSALGMVKVEMEVDGIPDYQTDLKNPNFAKLAEAIGVMEQSKTRRIFVGIGSRRSAFWSGVN